MDERNVKWHRMPPQAVVEQLHTDAACGLSHKAARSRLRRMGHSRLFGVPSRRQRGILRSFFSDPAILLMLFFTLLAFCFSQLLQAFSILFSVLLCVGMSWRTLRLWRRSARNAEKYRIPTVRVMRQGKCFTVFADLVVRGDLLLLSAGDIVPCDCRLLSASGLRVLTLLPNDAGEASFVQLPKCAETVYARDSVEVAPYFENMLYGGSEILEGEALAIAVETGEYTFLGAMQSFSVPAELTAGESVHTAAGTLKPYLQIYGVGMLILLFLLSVFGFLFSSAEKGVFDIFLPLCLLCAMASPALITVYFSMIDAHGRISCARTREHRMRTVVKSERGSEMLADLTDLLVVGERGLTDGAPHLFRAVVGEGEIPLAGEEIHARLAPLCEAFLLLHEAAAASPRLLWHADADALLLEELRNRSGFDEGAMHVRLQSVTPARTRERGIPAIDVTTKDGSYRLLFCSQASALERCTVYEDGVHRIALSPARRQANRAFFAEAEAVAAKATAVLRMQGEGEYSFVGMIAVREEVQIILPSVVEELEQSGVRTYFFPEKGSALADACHLPGKRAVCSAQTPHLTEALMEECRVFVGFPAGELSYAMRYLKQQRRTVAVLGGDGQERALLRYAPLIAVCDGTEYHRQENALRPSEEVARQAGSAPASSVMRRHADLVLSRASRHHGGLSALMQARSVFCAVREKTRMFFSFLLLSQSVRLAFAFLGVLFGMGSFSVLQMAVAGSVFEIFSLFWLLTRRLPQTRLRRSARFNAAAITERLRDLGEWIPTAGAVLIPALYAAVLHGCGVIPGEGANAYLFLSCMSLLLFLLYRLLWQEKLLRGGIDACLPLFAIALPIGLAVAFSVPFAPVHALTGLGVWHPATALALPLSVSAFLCIRFFYGFFRRTAK